MRRGVARKYDHAQLVHEIWMQLALNDTEIHVARVNTDDNLADLPSRKRFALLRQMGAKEVRPVLDDEYRHPEAWEVLQERWAAMPEK